MERYFACAGCRGLEKSVEAQAVKPSEKESAAASYGTMLHEANETGDVSDLSMDDEEQLLKIRASEEMYTKDWCSDHNIDFNTITVIREKRLWVTYSKTGRSVSAKIDTLVLADGGHCLLIDAKSGRRGATPPIRNQQLRTCVAVAASAYRIKTARVAIANLWGRKDPPCDYSEDDIAQVHRLLSERLDLIEQPSQPVVSGPHCLYCVAKAICPAQREQMSVAITSQRTLDWSLVTPESRKPLWIAADMAMKAGEAIKLQLKADLINDPTCAPGLLKKKDGTTRKIVDITEAFKTLVLEVPIPVEELSEELLMCEFIKECSIGLADYIAFVRSKTDMTKEQAARFIEEKCSSFIETSPRSGSVEVVD